MSSNALRTPGRVIRILTGCTAVGKTEFALRWAERFNAEILSCDSLLFYRGMDIGTAKPTREELSRVPHHLIDICDVTDQMDVTRFVAAAREVAESIVARGRRVLVTGGSGFYLKSFLAPVADGVEVSAEIRDRVRALTHEEAVKELRAMNPDGLGRLDAANPRRVVRALERCLASGRTVVELAEAFARQPSAFSDWEVRLVRVDRDRPELDRRIVARVSAMMAAGLVDEVRRLIPLGIERNPSAASAIGYREIIAALNAGPPPQGLEAAICRNTQGLVKKQRTWFRTQLPPHPAVNGDSADVETLFGRDD